MWDLEMSYDSTAEQPAGQPVGTSFISGGAAMYRVERFSGRTENDVIHRLYQPDDNMQGKCNRNGTAATSITTN